MPRQDSLTDQIQDVLAEAELEIAESQECCWTCGGTGSPLFGWGPFCSKICQDTADKAADEAADDRVREQGY